jgi:hypothetical protein
LTLTIFPCVIVSESPADYSAFTSELLLIPAENAFVEKVAGGIVSCWM